MSFQSTKQTLKTGTKIKLHGNILVPDEVATIGRWKLRNGLYKNSVGPNGTNTGWHVVKYADGGCLIVHESGFEVIK